MRYKKRNESFLSKEKQKNQQKETMEEKAAPPKKELLLKLPKKPPTSKKNSLMEQVSKLLDSKNTETITIKSLPFDENSSSDFIINGLLGSKDVPDRKGIKEIIRIWHPDKFSQMFNHRIHPDQKDDIIRIVTRISQALLNFGRQ